MDIVTISRVVLWAHDDAMLNHVFTQNEIESIRKKRSPHKHLASIFAAKEAFMKAIGTGWGKGVGWKDMEVLDGDDGLSMKLYDMAKKFCEGKRVFVSMNSTDTLAVAMVAIE